MRRLLLAAFTLLLGCRRYDCAAECRFEDFRSEICGEYLGEVSEVDRIESCEPCAEAVFDAIMLWELDQGGRDPRTGFVPNAKFGDGPFSDVVCEDEGLVAVP